MKTGPFALTAALSFQDGYAARCKPICAEMGLPQMALDILMVLADSDKDCTSARDISLMRGYGENLMSFHVARLLRDGYITRSRVEGDRRKYRLECTEKAWSYMDRAFEVQDQYFRDITEGLSEKERKQLLNMLAVVDKNARQIMKEAAE